MNKQKALKQGLLLSPHVVWCVLFIVAPLLFVAYYAFTGRGEGGDFSDGAFTLQNFLSVFTDGDYLGTFLSSLALALISTVICLLIAYPTAYFLSKLKVNHQRLMTVLLMLPMWMNFLVRTYTLTQLLDNNGLIARFLGLFGITTVQFLGTNFAVVLGMVYNYLPYMIVPIYTVMSKLDNRLIEAAADLGANSAKTLVRVVLPLTLSGIISGITMVFVPSISTFYVAKAMSNGSISLIGDIIETQFGALNYTMGSTLSFILMLLILISMFIMNRFGDDEKGGMVA